MNKEKILHIINPITLFIFISNKIPWYAVFGLYFLTILALVTFVFPEIYNILLSAGESKDNIKELLSIMYAGLLVLPLATFIISLYFHFLAKQVTSTKGKLFVFYNLIFNSFLLSTFYSFLFSLFAAIINSPLPAINIILTLSPYVLLLIFLFQSMKINYKINNKETLTVYLTGIVIYVSIMGLIYLLFKSYY